MSSVSSVSSSSPVRGASGVQPVHVVERGESLTSIAQQHHVSVADLRAANPQIRNAALIYPGDRIALPVSGAPAVSPAASEAGVDVVERGDTLATLARSHNVTLRALIASNPQLRNPNLIVVGDRINIPQHGAASAPVAAAAPLPSAAAPHFKGITAAQLKQIMPRADAAKWVAHLNAAMAAHGIHAPQQQAAFLAQIGVESGQLRATSENLNYSARRLMQVWPKRFPTLASALPYAHRPEALANKVYANRNGNGDAASGDGWTYRGGGLMQTTGRANYRRAGFEHNPQALREPATAADSAGKFWADNGLNARTVSGLSRSQYDGVTKTINGGLNHAQERWDMYQRALDVLK